MIFSVFSKFLLDVSHIYKTEDWVRYFKSTINMKYVVDCGLVGRPVNKDDKLPTGGITIEDLQLEGVLLLYPQTEGTGQYIIVLPQIFLHWFNLALNELALPLNVVEPLEGIWNWKKFEDFEAQYESIRVHLFLEIFF